MSHAAGRASVGRGYMERIWRGPAWTLPFLWVGSKRHIMFPESGRWVPFTVENYPFRDSLGREGVTWIRTFRLPRVRRFDAYMVLDPGRDRIVDYMGTHQHLAVDLDLRVGPDGGLELTSGVQRLHERSLGFRWPTLLTGRAHVREWYDDGRDCYRIQVAVRHRLFGSLFGYSGMFVAESVPAPPQLPERLAPIASRGPGRAHRS